MSKCLAISHSEECVYSILDILTVVDILHCITENTKKRKKKKKSSGDSNLRSRLRGSTTDFY